MANDSNLQSKLRDPEGWKEQVNGLKLLKDELYEEWDVPYEDDYGLQNQAEADPSFMNKSPLSLDLTKFNEALGLAAVMFEEMNEATNEELEEMESKNEAKEFVRQAFYNKHSDLIDKVITMTKHVNVTP